MFSASSISTLSFTSRSEVRRPLSSIIESEALFKGRSISGGVLSSETISEVLFQNVKDEKSYLRRYLNDVIEQSTAIGCLDEIEDLDETDLSLYLRRYLNDADGILTEPVDESIFELDDSFTRADATDNGEWDTVALEGVFPEIVGNEVVFHSDPSYNFCPVDMSRTGTWCIQEAQLTFKSFGDIWFTLGTGGRASGGVFIFAASNSGYYFTYSKTRLTEDTYRYDIALNTTSPGPGSLLGLYQDIIEYPSETVFKIRGVYNEITGFTRVIVTADSVEIFNVNHNSGALGGVFGMGAIFSTSPNSDSYWDNFSGSANRCSDFVASGPEICPVDFTEIAETDNLGYLRRYLNDKVS